MTVININRTYAAFGLLSSAATALSAVSRQLRIDKLILATAVIAYLNQQCLVHVIFLIKEIIKEQNDQISNSYYRKVKSMVAIDM